MSANRVGFIPGSPTSGPSERSFLYALSELGPLVGPCTRGPEFLGAGAPQPTNGGPAHADAAARHHACPLRPRCCTHAFCYRFRLLRRARGVMR
jgi:hypothetical protein